MHWLKTCLSLFLSFAILFVGSAAVAASVHSPCLMSSQDTQSMQMMNSEDHEKANAMHMDCMKADVKIKKQIHDPSCMSKQDCIMSFSKIAYTSTAQSVLQSVISFPAEHSDFSPLNQNFTSSDLSNLWKPPRFN